MDITSQFDLISDIHIDHWIQEKKNVEELERFTKSLLPDNLSKVLIIAGDLGHYNDQNYLLLQEFKKYYEYILLVAGNHDYWLINSKSKYKYEKNSLKRLVEMKKLSTSLNGVHYLDGNIFEIDGISYGGVGMWYDFSYGIKKLGQNSSQVKLRWESVMNDYSYIKKLGITSEFHFKHEKEKLDSIIDKSDVIITHVSPDWSKIPLKYEKSVDTSFYYFDGSGYFDRIYGKVWVSGHTHHKYDYINYGCWFLNNALGYPGENNGSMKIINVLL